MKEYKTIKDLSDNLKKEIYDNESFFNDFDGKSLDEQQRIACVLNDCDLEIIAGAGTGKTQTLVAKSSYLIEKKNISPDEVLCLSFSNSSVKDLSERLKYPIETRTIHAFGLSIIKQHNPIDVLDEYAFKEIFKQYLEDASQKELDEIKDYCEEYLANYSVKARLKELDYEEEKFSYLINKTNIHFKLQDFIDLYKGKDYSFSDLKKLKKICEKEYDEKMDFDILKNIYFLRIVEPVFRFYQAFLERNKLIDFNDMINKAIKIIQKEGVKKNYKYIFVDEYQDMSYKNFMLVKTLKDKTNAHLVVVGDDWQSIYGFRDSDLKLFTKFDEYFPNANRVFIEKTYRNPQQLIDTAGKFIMKNKSQFKKSLKSDLSIEKPIKIIYHSQIDEKEHNTIYNLISNLSFENKVMILGRHRNDINEFLKETNLVKKGRSRNYKKITDKEEYIENVEFRTIHKAKGLEADYTIIIQVIDNLVGFPNKLYPPYYMGLIHDWDNESKLEEERRLFYVALTRAKKGVYIFTTQNRESKYISELKKDNLKNLEIVYSNDKSTFSHLKEFKKVEKIKTINKTKNVNKSKKVKSNEKIQINHSYFENSQGIEIKANLKKTGNQYIKSKDYYGAIDFYNKLTTNMYFLNDYYPYRKLVEVYRKKKDSRMVILTIKEFFESKIYCNESQILWFKLDFKKACNYTNYDFNEFYSYLNYFNEHGLKNKDKQNDPVPIAARIQINKNKVNIISQEDFYKKSRKKELEYNYKFARLYESSAKALSYFEKLWDEEDFNRNLTAYKRLCSFYDDTGQYEKVIEISNEYFASDAKKTKSSPDWFKKKIAKAESKLNIENDTSLKNEISSITRDNENTLEKSCINNDSAKSSVNSSFYEEIDLKYNLYLKGNELLEDGNYMDAINFYEELVDNVLFKNDYHPYIKLTKAYHNAKEYKNEVNTIKKFFKSGIYCTKSKINFFKKKLEKLDELGYYDYSKIYELEDDFKRNGAKNKKLLGTPIPLAVNIKKGKKNINNEKIDLNSSEFDEFLNMDNIITYDEKVKLKYDLYLMGNQLLDSKNYYKAIIFYNKLLNHELFVNDYHPYLKLAIIYRKNKQHHKEVDIIVRFFKSGVFCDDKKFKWFKKRLKQLSKYGNYDFSLFYLLEDEFNQNGALNSHLSNEPVPIAANLKDYITLENYRMESNDNKSDDFNVSETLLYSKDYFNKLANEIQSHPDFVSDRQISQYSEDDFIEITCNYEKINEKADLINQGRELEKEDKLEAIKFYDSLKTNDLFVHDYYPYRRQCILFKNKLKDDFKDLDTIIELFNHEIYCNSHQYIWLHNKLLELIDKLNLSDYEIHKIDNLLKNYEENEEKYFKLQNTPVPISERIFKDENCLRLLSQEKYDFVQNVYYITELGVGYIRRGEYETAISYYLNLLESDILYYQYHAYKQLGRICKEMNNPDEFKRLYERLSNLDE